MLVRSGADPADAGAYLGVDTQEVQSWLADPAFQELIEAAEAYARTAVDTGVRPARPGEMQRRTSKGPVQVALPGQPMKCVALARERAEDRWTPTGELRPCRNWAMLGSNVCRTHGGANAVSKAAARRRVAAHTLGQLMDKVAHAAETDPLEAVLTELARSSVIVEALGVLVTGMNVDPDSGEAITAEDHKGVEQAHVLWEMLGEERDRKVKIAKAAIDAGIAERQVRVHEAQAIMLAQVIQAALSDPELGLDDEGRQRARVVFGRHLRSMPAGRSLSA